MRISPTMLSTWLQCPLKYNYEYREFEIRDTYKKETPAQFLGKVMHEALSDFHQLQPLEARTPEKFHELIRFRWGTRPAIYRRQLFGTRAMEARYGKEALGIAGAYPRCFDWRITPTHCEFRVEAGDGDLLLVGNIDRLDSGPEGPELVDYKTGVHLPSQEEVDGDLPLTFYAVAMELATGRRLSKLSLYHLREGKTIETYRAEDALRDGLDQIRSMAMEIKSATSFDPKPNRFCGSCDYAPLCPARSESLASPEGSGPDPAAVSTAGNSYGQDKANGI